MQGAAGMHRSISRRSCAAVADAAAPTTCCSICDEVATGFGRTGTLFAVEQCGVRPDLLCLGKGLTGGYLPMAATVASGRVLRRVPRPRPVASRRCTTATRTAGTPSPPRSRCATSQLLDEWDVLANVRARAEQLATRLLPTRIAPLHRGVAEVRLRGLMGGIELAPPADGLRWGRRVSAACVEPRRADPSARRRHRPHAAADHHRGRRSTASCTTVAEAIAEVVRSMSRLGGRAVDRPQRGDPRRRAVARADPCALDGPGP